MSSVIVTILAFIYYRFKGLDAVQSVLRGLRPAVVAMIAGAALSLLAMALCGGDSFTGEISIFNAVLFIAGLAVLWIWKLNPILVMAATGIIGLIAEVI